MTEDTLKAAIQKAYKGPGMIPFTGPLQRPAVVALSVHCLFVEAGFKPKRESTKFEFWKIFRKTSKLYTPDENWLAVLPSPEFVFRYTYPEVDGVFFLHCSIKEGTEQMFIQVSNDAQPDLSFFVGLLVNNTVRESVISSLRQKDSWDGVFGNLELLIYNIETYLLEPLRQAIQRTGARPTNSSSPSSWKLSWVRYSLITAFLALAVGTVFHRRNKK